MHDLTGLAAVIMIFGMPVALLGMYTFYRVRKLRTEERLTAMQRGVSVPMEPDLTEAAHSRRAGILLIPALSATCWPSPSSRGSNPMPWWQERSAPSRSRWDSAIYWTQC